MPKRTPQKPEQPIPGSESSNKAVASTVMQGASMEDRLWLFWKNNASSLIAGLVLGLVLIAGMEIYKYTQRSSAENRAVAFNAAQIQGAGALQAFAKENAGTTHGATANLLSAHAVFEAGNYTAATTQYTAAAQTFKKHAGTPNMKDADVQYPALLSLAARAEIGAAISQLKGQEAQAGKAQLQAIANNTHYLDTFRAEALYHLQMLAAKQGDVEAAQAAAMGIQGLALAGLWPEKSDALGTQL